MIINKINLSPFSLYIEYDDFNIDADIDFELSLESIQRLETVANAFSTECDIETFEQRIKKVVADYIKETQYSSAPAPYGNGQGLTKNKTYSIGIPYPFIFPQGIEDMNFMPNYSSEVKMIPIGQKWNWDFSLRDKGNGKWVITDVSFSPLRSLPAPSTTAVNSSVEPLESIPCKVSSPISYLNLKSHSIIIKDADSPINVEYALDNATTPVLEKAVLSCNSEGQIEELDGTIRRMVRAAIHELSRDDLITASVGNKLEWGFEDWVALKKFEFVFNVPDRNTLIVEGIKIKDL